MRSLAALLLLAPAAALAQAPAAEDLGTLLGAGVRWRPEYDGASKQEVDPIPMVRWYGSTLFARTTQGILEGGARVHFARGLAGGVQVAYEQGNDRTGFDPSASVGAHVEWDTSLGPAPFNLLGRVRRHMHTENRTLADLRATIGVYGDARLLLGVFGQATWASDEWMRKYYLVGGGGIVYYALGLEGALQMSRHWVLFGAVHGRRLQDAAASSPITEERTNAYASLALAYRF